MKKIVLGFVVLLLLGTAAFAKGAPHAKGVLHDAHGKKVGVAKFSEAAGQVQIALSVSNLKPGSHGIHIHEMGKCDSPDFKSAGAHFNPAHKKHGAKNHKGAHAGDLPNLAVDPDGKAKTNLVAKGITLQMVTGKSLVIHADPDDEKTDPSGNSGARIVCGVIR